MIKRIKKLVRKFLGKNDSKEEELNYLKSRGLKIGE